MLMKTNSDRSGLWRNVQYLTYLGKVPNPDIQNRLVTSRRPSCLRRYNFHMRSSTILTCDKEYLPTTLRQLGNTAADRHAGWLTSTLRTSLKYFSLVTFPKLCLELLEVLLLDRRLSIHSRMRVTDSWSRCACRM